MNYVITIHDITRFLYSEHVTTKLFKITNFQNWMLINYQPPSVQIISLCWYVVSMAHFTLLICVLILILSSDPVCYIDHTRPLLRCLKKGLVGLIGKGKVVPVLNWLRITPWRRMGEWMYRSTFSWPRHQLEVSGQLHAPAALPPVPIL
jgi:hypothetical protein